MSAAVNIAETGVRGTSITSSRFEYAQACGEYEGALAAQPPDYARAVDAATRATWLAAVLRLPLERITGWNAAAEAASVNFTLEHSRVIRQESDVPG